MSHENLPIWTAEWLLLSSRRSSMGMEAVKIGDRLAFM
jgi:hypothetical protein